MIFSAKAAGAEIWPSIGGWSLSDPFPAMASSEVARVKFANKCVQLIEEYGFDGIDIDWEYPGYEAHSGTPEDKGNYNLLLQTIREKLDELGERSGGKFYGLTAALPCGTNHINNIDIQTVAKYLSELNLMTYDFFGAWSPTTGINAPLYDQSWGGEDTVGFSIDGCTKNWVAGGGDPSKINIGLPFYGRSFLGATGLNQEHEHKADDGMWKEDDGAPQYFNIVERLGTNPLSTEQKMHSYRNEETSTQYAWYNIYGTTGLVSYDDEEAICDKTQYCIDNELNGFIIWEISGDLMLDGSTPLIDAVHAKLNDPQLDCKHFHYEDSLPSPSITPTISPTIRPTPRPTPISTPNPSKQATKQPSRHPSPYVSPQQEPSVSSSNPPTRHPSTQLTSKPFSNNVVESTQSFSAAFQIITPLLPTSKPSSNPTTNRPTPQPSQSITKTTRSPTRQPSRNPTTKVPTLHPTMKADKPTSGPTNKPSKRPSSSPTRNELGTNAMAMSFVSSSASAFVSPTQYSLPHPQTPPTRMPQQKPTVPTPRPTTSTVTQQSVPMKGENPKSPLNPGSSAVVETEKNQILPLKKGTKKKQKMKQFNAVVKKGQQEESKKRPA